MIDRRRWELIDLTHTLTAEVPNWDGDCGFRCKVCTDYADCSPDTPFRIQSVEMKAGIGTHMDAPAHCFAGNQTIDKLELEQFLGPCCVIDMKTMDDETSCLQEEDVLRFEKQFGGIPKDSIVLVRTGWAKYWDNPNRYRNNLVFPTVSKEAAELLVDRGIKGLGIDTISPDRLEDGFPVHHTILGAGGFLIENVANLDRLSPTGYTLMVLPIKIGDGTEAPVRMVAFKEKS